MRGVARGADGGDRQPFLEQPFAVDRVGVVLEDRLLRNVAEERDLGPLLVAASAEERHAHHRDRGLRIGVRDDLVAAVAGDAGGGQAVAALRGLAVQAGVLLADHRGVALCAGRQGLPGPGELHPAPTVIA